MAREMKDSGIEWVGRIPSTWDSMRLKYAASYNDETLDENTAEDYEFDYIDIGSVEYGKGITQYQHMRFQEAPSRARRIVKNNDVILSTVRTYLKAVASIEERSDPQIVSTGFVVLRARIGKITPLFLKYAVLSNAFISLVEAKSTGISYPAINSTDVMNIAIPLPELSEQQKITDYLDIECARIDAVMEQTRASIEEYKKLKQAVITQAVTKGIRSNRPMKDSRIDWLGKVPVDWNVYRIANLYDERNESGEDSLPILSVSINTGISDHEVADEEQARAFVRSEDKSKYKRVYPGDLAYNMMRAWQGAFGAVRVDGMVSPAYVVAKPKHNINLDSRYMEALLRTPSAIEEMHRYSHGITDFRLRLYWPEFKNIRVCIPSIDEQKEISDYIDKIASYVDTMISRKEQLLTEMESYKKSLIFEYITGKREIK